MSFFRLQIREKSVIEKYNFLYFISKLIINIFISRLEFFYPITSEIDGLSSSKKYYCFNLFY